MVQRSKSSQSISNQPTIPEGRDQWEEHWKAKGVWVDNLLKPTPGQECEKCLFGLTGALVHPGCDRHSKPFRQSGALKDENNWFPAGTYAGACGAGDCPMCQGLACMSCGLRLDDHCNHSINDKHKKADNVDKTANHHRTLGISSIPEGTRLDALRLVKARNDLNTMAMSLIEAQAADADARTLFTIRRQLAHAAQEWSRVEPTVA